MKTQLLEYWNNQYILSGKKHFPQFLKLLSQGGNNALDFINSNKALISTLGGDTEELNTLIAKDNEVAENKAWFFSQAMVKLRDVKGVLNHRFNATVNYAKSLGVVTDNWTDETIIEDINGVVISFGANVATDQFDKKSIIAALKEIGVEVSGNISKAKLNSLISDLNEEDAELLNKKLSE